ncbi:MAG TPA: M23 family metallopeptidase [Candidatus Krumholzibacteria bacterium]|jgi:murein DD-endopeptidase MepM/ murein hydrolase activator NlpD
MATKNPKQVVATFIILLGLLVTGIGLGIWRQRTPGVVGVFLSEPRALGSASPLELELHSGAANVLSFRAELHQAQTQIQLASLDFAGDPQKDRVLNFTIDLRESGLAEDDALLLIYASDDLWRPKAVDRDPILRRVVRVDLTPPELTILGATRYPEQGGAGVVAVRAEAGARVSLRFGEEHFPAHPNPRDEKIHVAYFALPFDADTSNVLQALATDEAGNERVRSVDVQIRVKRFATGTVNVPEDWLRQKLPELLPDGGDIGPDDYDDAFLKLNNQMRAEAAAFKRELATRSSSLRLWDGPFIQPRNTRVFSNFAETRDYLLAGTKVDTQVHLGFDLASVKHAIIPAANSGRVVFVGDLGIYGTAIVVDHGQGLMTLYAHLSALNVAEGDELKSGDEIGRSGSSGLAVGDHLHYEVLVHGIPVTPLQWWDEAWIRDHIAKPLDDAGLDTPRAH